MPDFIGGGAPTSLNGTTWVEVVAAPGSGSKRQVLSVFVRNMDIVAHVFESRLNKNGTGYTLYVSESVPVGEVAQLVSNCYLLAATDESFEVRTQEATTNAQSVAHVCAFEVP